MIGPKTAYVAPGSQWENGYVESFNGKLRDEVLKGEVFGTVREAQVLIETWWVHYNTRRPHPALGYWPHLPEAVLWPASPAMRGARPATRPVAFGMIPN